ncbi:MAG TPA: DUF3098 domain-containing protein [Chitinophagales bacterium]|nr:DUF3098 domain-containing protein [Chitinophagales bacterium]
MAKNQPVQKNIPQAKQAQPTVKSTAKPKTSSGGSWLRLPSSQNTTLLFDRTNYIILGVGVLLIIIGFILMSGGNTDPKVFNEAEIYSFQRITLAPITVIAGFAIIVVAILKKPSSDTSAS